MGDPRVPGSGDDDETLVPDGGVRGEGVDGTSIDLDPAGDGALARRADLGVDATAAEPTEGAREPELVEAEPTLKLTVAGPCNNPNGLYVGLGQKQRDKLDVEVGDTVVLRDPATKEIIGYYVVGLGSSKLKDEPTRFTANGVEVGKEVEVVKASAETQAAAFKLNIVSGAEAGEKHEKRKGIIAERFGAKGFDGEIYIVLPTALAKKITGQETQAKVASIALGKVKILGEEVEIPIVPAGNDFAMTSAAATKLKMPASITAGEFYVNEANVLVMNQATT